MSGQAEIKWTKADEARLRKAQRNARDKSRRLLAKEEKIKAGELPRPVGQVTIIKNIPTCDGGGQALWLCRARVLRGNDQNHLQGI